MNILKEIRPRAEHLSDAHSETLLQSVITAPPQKPRLQGRTRVAALSLAGIVVAGASVFAFSLVPSNTAGDGAADCILTVRREGTVFRMGAFAEHAAATEAGLADKATCSDVGEDARGSYFPDDPERVAVWVFEGLDQDQVLGIPAPGGAFDVLIAEGTPKAEVKRIVDLLGQPQ